MMNRFATFVFAFCLCDSHERNSGGYSVGVPPLPIPNREVKPDRADGTAKVGEWVAAVLVSRKAKGEVPLQLTL